MPKRKLADVNGSSAADNKYKPLSLQAVRLTTRFEQGAVGLSRALKTARGFERQKLGRREKTAKSQDNGKDSLERLAGEINVLKTLDLLKTAQKYLYKQLVKTKRIAESPYFIEFQEAQAGKIPTDGPRDAAEANVTARLFKSNPVKNVLPGVMEDVRKILKVDDAPKKQSKSEGKEKKSKESESKVSDKRKPDLKKESSGEPEEGSDEERAGNEDIDMDDAESMDFAQFDSRLASGSEDEDEDGSENDDNDDDIPHPSHNSDISISRSPTPESESELPPSKKTKKKKEAAAPVTSTTFLPSLSMGYFSGSESEAEDYDEKPVRKNRMGQQARRALWEKKYGSGANHVKKQKKDERRNRDSGWDSRKGATGGNSEKLGSRGGARHDSSQRNNMPRKKEDEGPLHPSWEAAKKAKEQKPATFAGTKVTFD